MTPGGGFVRRQAFICFEEDDEMNKNIAGAKSGDKRHPISFLFYFLSAICFALLGCDTPTTERLVYVEADPWELITEPDPEEPEEELEEIEASIVFTDAAFVASADMFSETQTVSTITFPETGVWTAALVPGPGSTHNDKFHIEYGEEGEPVQSVSAGNGGSPVFFAVNRNETAQAPSQARLVINDDVTTLEWGHYSVRVKIASDDGLEFIKVFAFDVTLCPPLFKNPPRIYPVVAKTDGTYPTLDMQYATGNIPDIAGGKNKLVIRWDKRATATSYTVYVSKSDAFSEAKPLTSPHTEVPGTGMMSVEMTDFPGDPVTGYLPDSTTYWVWTTATNDLGTTPPSPAAKKKTSTPVQEFFYENVDENDELKDQASYFDCGGYGDFYRFTPTTVKYWFGSFGGYNYLGDIIYNEVFDPPSPDSNYPFPNTLKGGQNCLGLPAGVFVIKYREGHVPPALTEVPSRANRRYSAVYYWGVGAEHSNGRIYAGIVNQWSGYAETVTLEDAMDKFTAENVRSFLGLTPEPYYKNFSDDMSGTTGEGGGWEPWIGEGRYDGD
jgi:hypothetical protein